MSRPSHIFSPGLIPGILPGLFSVLLLVFAVSTLYGCDSGKSSNSDALVVDVMAVARALGRDEVMQQQLDQARQLLNKQLLQISTDLNAQLKEKQAEITGGNGKDSEEVKMKLDALARQASVQLSNTQKIATQKAADFRGRLVKEFRDEVMHVSQGIAQQRKAEFVYTSSTLLWYASPVDITDEVIGQMRAQQNRLEDSDKSGSGASDTGVSGTDVSGADVSGAGAPDI